MFAKYCDNNTVSNPCKQSYINMLPVSKTPLQYCNKVKMLLQTLLVPEHLKLLPREVHATYFLERIGNPASHSLLRKLRPYKMQAISVN